jgi:hypothetical protein
MSWVHEGPSSIATLFLLSWAISQSFSLATSKNIGGNVILGPSQPGEESQDPWLGMKRAASAGYRAAAHSIIKNVAPRNLVAKMQKSIKTEYY